MVLCMLEVQLVLNYLNPDYLYPDFWTSAIVAMFFVPAGKIRCGHWSFVTGESMCPILLSEAANAAVHCITVWQIKRLGK